MPVYMHLSYYWDLLFQEQTVCMIKGFENERRLKWGLNVRDVEILSASRLTARFWPSGEEESEIESEDDESVLGEKVDVSSKSMLWGTKVKAKNVWDRVRGWFGGGGNGNGKTKLIRVKSVEPQFELGLFQRRPRDC